MLDNENTSTVKSTGFSWKTAVTDGLRYVLRLLKGLLWEAVFLTVLCAWLLWISIDFLPKRRSKPLTSPPQNRHRLPHLRRDGSNVFWEMPDGEIIPLEPLQASLVLQEVAEVVGGALTYELTRLPDDNTPETANR